jgi:hypothetical protein
VLRASLEALLSLKNKDYGGLYNPLYIQELELERLRIYGKEIHIFLQGYYLPYDSCDELRIEAQLRYTALQFDNIETVIIFINGKRFPPEKNLQ